MRYWTDFSDRLLEIKESRYWIDFSNKLLMIKESGYWICFLDRLLKRYPPKCLNKFCPTITNLKNIRTTKSFLKNKILYHPRSFPITDYTKIAPIIIMDLKRKSPTLLSNGFAH